MPDAPALPRGASPSSGSAAAVRPLERVSVRLGVLAAALTGLVLICAQIGAVAIAPGDWLHGPWSSTPASGGAYVLWQLRLPRLGLGMAVGAALGLAGALSQALFRNPMADPGLLGVTSGAAAAVALSLTVLSGLQLMVPPDWRLWFLPVVGFAGAMVVCFSLERLARWLAPGSIAALLLSGLAIQALAFSVVGLCTQIATDEQLRSLNFWTLGSVAEANTTMLLLMLVTLAVVSVPAWRLTTQLNALALGEATAAHVGVDIDRLRWTSIMCVAMLSAMAVAWCGSIGFIGLIAPHLARHGLGADQRRVLPGALLCGAILLVAADTLARTLAAPAEIPVGIFTSLLGAPWFLWQLRGALKRMGTA